MPKHDGITPNPAISGPFHAYLGFPFFSLRKKSTIKSSAKLDLCWLLDVRNG